MKVFKRGFLNLAPLVFLSLSLVLVGNDAGANSTSLRSRLVAKPDQPWRWDYFKIALGGKFQSSLQKRGAIFYRSWQLTPIWAIDLFHPSLQIVGSTLLFSHHLTDWLRYRSRFALSATGDRPLYLTGGMGEGPQNQRKGTMELDQFLELRDPLRGELRFQVSQDLSAHGGTHLEAKLRAVVANIEWKPELILQPALTAALGLGSQSHNEYLYGSGAGEFGANHASFGLSLAMPPAIDYFFPVLEIERTMILGNENKNASLVQGRTSGYQVTFLFAIELWRNSPSSL